MKRLRNEPHDLQPRECKDPSKTGSGVPSLSTTTQPVWQGVSMGTTGGASSVEPCNPTPRPDPMRASTPNCHQSAVRYKSQEDATAIGENDTSQRPPRPRARRCAGEQPTGQSYLSNARRGGSRQCTGTKHQTGAQHDDDAQENNPDVVLPTTGDALPGHAEETVVVAVRGPYRRDGTRRGPRPTERGHQRMRAR